MKLNSNRITQCCGLNDKKIRLCFCLFPVEANCFCSLLNETEKNILLSSVVVTTYMYVGGIAPVNKRQHCVYYLITFEMILLSFQDSSAVLTSHTDMLSRF